MAMCGFVHELSDSPDLQRRRRQMDVDVQQSVRVQFATRFKQRVAQPRQMALSIVVVRKAGQSFFPALENAL